MLYVRCTGEELCDYISGWASGAKSDLEKVLEPDQEIRIFENGEVRAHKYPRQHIYTVGIWNGVQLERFSDRVGRFPLDPAAIKILHDWQYGGIGGFHGHLMAAFGSACGDNAANLAEGFPTIATAYVEWKQRGSDWLYEEHHGAPRV